MCGPKNMQILVRFYRYFFTSAYNSIRFYRFSNVLSEIYALPPFQILSKKSGGKHDDFSQKSLTENEVAESFTRNFSSLNSIH